MSRNIAASAKSRIKTHNVRIDIFGGERDYCVDSVAFRNDNGTLVSTYSAPEYDAGTTTISPAFADYIPEVEMAASVHGSGKVCFNTLYGEFVTEVKIDSYCNPFFYTRWENGESKCVYIGGERVYHLPDFEDFPLRYTAYCGVLHGGRLFIRDYDDGYLIRWTCTDFDETDYRSWDESIDGGGHLRLDVEGGPVLWMHSLGTDIVIFRETGITELHAAMEPRLFSLGKTTYRFYNYIGVKGSAVCGGKVWFCTEDSVYSFDGNSIERLKLERFMNLYTFKGVKAHNDRFLYFHCYRGGSHYLCEYDIFTKRSTVFGKGGQAVWRYYDNLLIVIDRGVKFMETDSMCDYRLWKSEAIDLGTNAEKTLKRLIVDCDSEIEVSVVTDNGKTCSTIKSGKYNVGLTGTAFTFSFKGYGSVFKVTAEWEVKDDL